MAGTTHIVAALASVSTAASAHLAVDEQESPAQERLDEEAQDPPPPEDRVDRAPVLHASESLAAPPACPPTLGLAAAARAGLGGVAGESKRPSKCRGRANLTCFSRASTRPARRLIHAAEAFAAGWRGRATAPAAHASMGFTPSPRRNGTC